MSRPRLFIGGVHGTGKSLLSKQITQILVGKYISASKLLRWKSKSKKVDNIYRNQVVLSELLQTCTKEDSSYIIDGHFALWNKDNKCEEVPLETFVSLELSAIIIATSPPQIIHNRLKHRDDIKYKLEDIVSLQAVEMKQAKYVAKYLNVPLIIVDTTNVMEIKNLMKQIIQMKPYTRENLLSPMLKTVIIRVDFEGLTDELSFVNSIKIDKRMQDSFKQIMMIPRHQMNVSFRPKDIEDGQLPITENQRSTIYRFYDCMIGNGTKVTLDIESGSVTLAIDCQTNYHGSRDYSNFMTWLIEKLSTHDPYVRFKRLGVRKIDVQVLSPEETIDTYFNERYIVSQSWSSYPHKTKSILTELIEVNDINFNVTQHIDTVGNGCTRLIYDIDAYITKDAIKQSLTKGNIFDVLYHDMQDPMFDLFVSVASENYLDACKRSNK